LKDLLKIKLRRKNFYFFLERNLLPLGRNFFEEPGTVRQIIDFLKEVDRTVWISV